MLKQLNAPRAGQLGKGPCLAPRRPSRHILQSHPVFTMIGAYGLCVVDRTTFEGFPGGPVKLEQRLLH